MIPFDRTGLILYVQQYQACVDFYANKLELPQLFHTEMLTCFAFGDAYLMVEQDDEVDLPEKAHHRIRTCLRMNVPDVQLLANRLTAQGVAVDYQEHEWGTIAKFFDPDGNLCAFKDSRKFEQQVRSGSHL